jgi:hypothetical protein
MRAPYLQIAMEVLELHAPELAVALEWNEDSAFTGLVKIFRWGFARVPEGEMPSGHNIVRGPTAAKLIARAAGYQGDPDAFVDACCVLAPDAPLERVEGGVRLCGLSRYDSMVTKRKVDRERANLGRTSQLHSRDVAATSQLRSGDIAATSQRHRGEVATTSMGQTQSQTQSQSQKSSPSEKTKEAGDVCDALSQPEGGSPTPQPPPPEPEPRRMPPQVEPPDSEPDAWDGRDFWRWAQSRRQAGGYVTEPWPKDRILSTWWSDARAVVHDVHRLKGAFYAFGQDKYWERVQFPFRAFMSQWSKYVPPEVQ